MTGAIKYDYIFLSQGICREINCSPGRIYSHGDCSGLFLSIDPLGPSGPSRTREFGLAAKITFKDVIFSGTLNQNTLTWAVIAAIFPFTFGIDIRFARYYTVTNVPCTPDKYLEPVTDLAMHLYVDIVFNYRGNDFDETFAEMFDLQYKIQINNFSASFIMKSDSKSALLPKPQYSQFPFLFCKYDWRNPDYHHDHENTNHVFMIDKFLLCPQITLNSSEYLIKPRSNSLQLRLAQTGGWLDYTIVNSDIRVCLIEYDAIMTTSVGTTSALYHVTAFIRCVLFLSIFVY